MPNRLGQIRGRAAASSAASERDQARLELATRARIAEAATAAAARIEEQALRESELAGRAARAEVARAEAAKAESDASLREAIRAAEALQQMLAEQRQLTDGYRHAAVELGRRLEQAETEGVAPRVAAAAVVAA